jgi:hypothetical protein
MGGGGLRHCHEGPALLLTDADLDVINEGLGSCRMDKITCTQCGATGSEPGFLDVVVGGGIGADMGLRWNSGEFERRWDGRPKRSYLRTIRRVEAQRCAECGHLELFAIRPI